MKIKPTETTLAESTRVSDAMGKITEVFGSILSASLVFDEATVDDVVKRAADAFPIGRDVTDHNSLTDEQVNDLFINNVGYTLRVMGGLISRVSERIAERVVSDEAPELDLLTNPTASGQVCERCGIAGYVARSPVASYDQCTVCGHAQTDG